MSPGPQCTACPPARILESCHTQRGKGLTVLSPKEEPPKPPQPPRTHPQLCRPWCEGPCGSRPGTRTCSCLPGSHRVGCRCPASDTRQCLCVTEKGFCLGERNPFYRVTGEQNMYPPEAEGCHPHRILTLSRSPPVSSLLFHPPSLPFFTVFHFWLFFCYLFIVDLCI